MEIGTLTHLQILLFADGNKILTRFVPSFVSQYASTRVAWGVPNFAPMQTNTLTGGLNITLSVGEGGRYRLREG